MRLRTLLSINAVLAGAFGVAFVLAPGPVFSLYGSAADATLKYSGQLLGATFIETAVIMLLAREFERSAARQAIVLAFVIGNAVGLLVTLIAQLNGVLGPMGWSSVAIYLLLTLGYGYFQFISPMSEESPAIGE